jgi:2-polyprenyl-3-methyl-5-hydroxy-6-metoxy-1,4-benzoquinol methylase
MAYDQGLSASAPQWQTAAQESSTGGDAAAYYRHERSDISPLLPNHAQRILDVGCGEGATLAWLKGRYPAAVTIGLEGNQSLRNRLSSNADAAHIVDLNADIPDVGSPDLILCLDVLEHLTAPEQVLARLVGILAPNGTVIVSLPNVAHLSVSLPLIMRGEFQYRDAGILDRTHLRFFVKRSAIELLNGAGLVVERALRLGLDGPKSRWVNLISLGLLQDHLTTQYVLAARLAGDGGRQGAIKWQLG